MHVRNTREVARLAATIPATYMVFDLLRLDGVDLTRHAAARAPRRAGRAGPAGHRLAGAAGVRRRGDAARGHAAAGAGGDGQQATVVALRVRRAEQGVAEVRAPTTGLLRRRRLAARDGLAEPHRRPSGRRADRGRRIHLPRPGRVGHRRRQGPQARRGARPARPRHEPVQRRGAARRRPRHPVGGARAGGRRRVAGPLEPAAAAAAGVPGVCAPTSTWKICSCEPGSRRRCASTSRAAPSS